MSEEEFFNKYIMENPFSFKNGIIAHCRKLDKEDVYEWVANDELKIRKLIQENQQLKEQLQQKEDIINKTNKKIERMFEIGDGNRVIDDLLEIQKILDNKG